MSKTLELTFADGSRIQVEGSEADTVAERGFEDVVERVTEPFDVALGTVRSIADSLHASLKNAVSPPDVVMVQFGINFTVESGMILAKGSAGANLQITMQWNKA